MDIKQVYREETELDVYAEHSLNYANYTNEYVKWLEAKINYTHCCAELKVVDIEDDWIEEMIEKETMSAEWRKENL